METDRFVSLKDLAERLGMDRSHARRYIKKLGYNFHLRRTQNSRGQLTLCVSEEEAEAIFSQRTNQGFTAPNVVLSQDVGYFYVIQLIPELDPKRLKLGFAENLEQRLSQHRTAAPTASLFHAWPCKRTWELTALEALTSAGCQLLLNEVFECEDPKALIERGGTFFSLLPYPDMRIPISANSPLNTR